jgi:hypothetical protein
VTGGTFAAVRGWRATWWLVAGGVAIAGCGGGAKQSAGEPHARFPVRVSTASFPARQHLAQQTHLVIAVRNAGTRTIPDISVTLVNPRYGTAAQALGTLIAPNPPGQPVLAGRSRAVWVIDQDPGPCQYSCRQGGPGAATTADSNTWALGRLKPGATATFDWRVTAVQPGRYTVEYQIAADLAGGPARAVGPGGARPQGEFHVTIAGAPQGAYVNNQGKVVYTN